MNKRHLRFLNPIIEYLNTYEKDAVIYMKVGYMNAKPISAYENNGENLVFFDNEHQDTIIDLNTIDEVVVSGMALKIKQGNGKQYNFVAKPISKKEKAKMLLKTLRDTLLYDIFPDDHTFWENNGDSVSEVMRCIKELKELNED